MLGMLDDGTGQASRLVGLTIWDIAVTVGS